MVDLFGLDEYNNNHRELLDYASAIRSEKERERKKKVCVDTGENLERFRVVEQVNTKKRALLPRRDVKENNQFVC